MRPVNTAKQLPNGIDASADPIMLKVVFVGDSNEYYVPIEASNTDYKAVLAWVDAGNTIADPE